MFLAYMGQIDEIFRYFMSKFTDSPGKCLNLKGSILAHPRFSPKNHPKNRNSEISDKNDFLVILVIFW